MTAEINHSHSEDIKGTQVTTVVIFMASTSATKEEIRTYNSKEFSYDLRQTYGDISPTYCFEASCQETVL